MKNQKHIYHKYQNKYTGGEHFVLASSKVDTSKYLTRLDDKDYIMVIPRGMGNISYQAISEVKQVEEKGTVKTSK